MVSPKLVSVISQMQDADDVPEVTRVHMRPEQAQAFIQTHELKELFEGHMNGCHIAIAEVTAPMRVYHCHICDNPGRVTDCSFNPEHILALDMLYTFPLQVPNLTMLQKLIQHDFASFMVGIRWEEHATIHSDAS